MKSRKSGEKRKGGNTLILLKVTKKRNNQYGRETKKDSGIVYKLLPGEH